MTAPLPHDAPAAPPPRGGGLWLLVFPLLALLLLWPVLLGGQVLLPAEYLRGFSPWNRVLGPPPGGEPPQWNILQWDGMAEFYPWRLHAARSFAEGRIPLWNPHVLSGTPFLANSQSAPLYPLHVLYYLPLGVDIAVRMGWLAFLHLSLAGAFAFLLARSLNVRPAAALVAGAAYELSGFAVAWLELPSFIAVSCWIPLALLCLSRAVRQQSWGWTAGAGAAGGMMLLSGHLQVAFYGLLAAGGIWLWETVRLLRRTPENRTQSVLQATLAGAAFLGAALALAAPQMLPSMELSRMSHRAGTPSEAGYEAYVKLAMPPQHWITLLAPDYYGLPGRSDYWGLWNYGPPNVMEYAGHVGAAAVLLVVLGLLWGRRIAPETLFWAAAGGVALLLASGTPLNRLFYFYIPGFAQSGSPARSLVLVCLAQAMLAGLGMEWLLRRSEAGLKAVLLPLAAGAGVTLTLLGGAHGLAQATMPQLGPLMTASVEQVALPALLRAALAPLLLAGLVLLAAWLLRENAARQRTATVAGAALLVVAGGQLLLGQQYNLTAPPSLAYPPTPLTDALRRLPGRVATLNDRWDILQQPSAVLPPNASLAYGWRDAQGYDSLFLGTYRRIADAVAGDRSASPEANGNIVYVRDASSPLLPLLGARYLVSQQPLSRVGLLLAGGLPPGPPYVYEDRFAAPEAYLTTDWTVQEDAAGLAHLRKLSLAGKKNAAYVAPAAPAAAAPSASGGYQPGGAATLTRAAAGDLRVEAAPVSPSLLVLLEGFAPGWRARLQAPGAPPRELPVLRVNTAFQGVLLPAGPATVIWRYEPASFRVGLFLALLAVAVLLAALISRPKVDARILPSNGE